jgi:hypothetical protein
MTVGRAKQSVPTPSYDATLAVGTALRAFTHPTNVAIPHIGRNINTSCGGSMPA